MVTVKAVNRTQPVIKEMAIHLRTMANPLSKSGGEPLGPTTFNRHAGG